MNNIALLLMYLGLIYIIIKEAVLLLKLKKIELKDKTRYRFCQIRRDLIKLVHEEKLPVNSFVFSVFYGSCSDIIHYIDDYQFNSVEFIRKFSQRPSSSDLKKMEKLINDVEKYDKEVHQIVDDFCNSILFSLNDNSFVFRFLTENPKFQLFFKQYVLPILESFKFQKIDNIIEKLKFQKSLRDVAMQVLELTGMTHLRYAAIK